MADSPKEEEQGLDLTVGMRVTARWYVATESALSGTQLKFGAKERTVTGTVEGIYGDHPTAPTKFELSVRPDGGGDPVRVKPEHVVVLDPGGPDERRIKVHGTAPARPD